MTRHAPSSGRMLRVHAGPESIRRSPLRGASTPTAVAGKHVPRRQRCPQLPGQLRALGRRSWRPGHLRRQATAPASGATSLLPPPDCAERRRGRGPARPIHSASSWDPRPPYLVGCYRRARGQRSCAHTPLKRGSAQVSWEELLPGWNSRRHEAGQRPASVHTRLRRAERPPARGLRRRRGRPAVGDVLGASKVAQVHGAVPPCRSLALPRACGIDVSPPRGTCREPRTDVERIRSARGACLTGAVGPDDGGLRRRARPRCCSGSTTGIAASPKATVSRSESWSCGRRSG